MLLVDEYGCGKNGNQEPLSLKHQVDVSEIRTYQGVTTGNQAPHCPQFNCLVGNMAYFSQGEFFCLCLLIMGRQVYVAVAAILGTAGSNLQGKREETALLFFLFPQGMILDFPSADKSVTH
jgi:hypothetical protein